MEVHELPGDFSFGTPGELEGLAVQTSLPGLGVKGLPQDIEARHSPGAALMTRRQPLPPSACCSSSSKGPPNWASQAMSLGRSLNCCWYSASARVLASSASFFLPERNRYQRGVGNDPGPWRPLSTRAVSGRSASPHRVSRPACKNESGGIEGSVQGADRGQPDKLTQPGLILISPAAITGTRRRTRQGTILFMAGAPFTFGLQSPLLTVQVRSCGPSGGKGYLRRPSLTREVSQHPEWAGRRGRQAGVIEEPRASLSRPTAGACCPR